MRNRIIFYSSVGTKTLFQTQKFYQVDIDILKRMGYTITLSNKISEAFLFWKYDIVFAYFFRYSFFFALIAKMFGKNVYITGGIDALDREYAGEKAYKIQKFFFRLCYAVADKCIIVSKTDLNHVEEIVGKGAKKIAYSEHTIEANAFCDAKFEDKTRDFCTIGWMGNSGNVRRKGIDKAIYLFSLLKKKAEFTNSKLYIMGRKGEGTIMLESLIKELGLEKSVIITGEVTENEKIDLLKKCMYYFQLSYYEGFGVAALEALIAGNIIIHSGNGGLKNPIYKNHILVDIDSNIEKQVYIIYERLLNVDREVVEKNAKNCLLFYDNTRRLRDFEEIIKNAT